MHDASKNEDTTANTPNSDTPLLDQVQSPADFVTHTKSSPNAAIKLKHYAQAVDYQASPNAPRANTTPSAPPTAPPVSQLA